MPTTPDQPVSRAQKILAAIDALPPLPAVAIRVMEVAQDPKSSASDLALVVSSDPGLSGRLLRVVNSAAYRRSREITSVQEALVTLGFVQARNMAISGAIAGAYSPDALNALFRIEVFWRHSIAVAFKAAEFAGKSRRLDVPSAFTAGILHNMGRLAMYYADPAGLDQAIAEAM
ncbi:MAG TPA: HDOD domain-containing protein, partial [Tepidiformaceae bacterium]|nr:HDOD domain-containing protein [Tepidiformaceae bacterium]